MTRYRVQVNFAEGSGDVFIVERDCDIDSLRNTILNITGAESVDVEYERRPFNR